MKTLLLLPLLILSTWAYAQNDEPLLNFELPWMNHDGDAQINYKSIDHPNGIFVIEGYFNGCPYCHLNAPNVNQLAKDYETQKKVQVLDVGYDCKVGQYMSWISAESPNHPVLNDCRGNKLLLPLGFSAYPSTAIINCKGEVVWTHVDVWDEVTITKIKSIIDELLKTECIHNL